MESVAKGFKVSLCEIKHVLLGLGHILGSVEDEGVGPLERVAALYHSLARS